MLPPKAPPAKETGSVFKMPLPQGLAKPRALISAHPPPPSRVVEAPCGLCGLLTAVAWFAG